MMELQVKAMAHPRARRPREVFPLAWTAYVRPMALFLAVAAIGGIWSQSAKTADFILAGYGVLFIGIAKLLYDIAWRRRYRFYYDSEGVWVESGLLPWRRGRDGMYWEEIEEAEGESGALGWLTRACHIRIYPRGDEEGALAADHIRHGRQAVAAINERLLRDDEQ